MTNTKHIPVLLNNTIDALEIQKGEIVVDCTLGGGGHLKEVIKRLEGKGKIIAIDIDEKALINAGTIVENEEKIDIEIVKGNFGNIKALLSEIKIDKVDGIYADLGFSTDQIEWLSFKNEGELDLRMDKTLGIKASDLINGLHKKELIRLFEDYADIKNAVEFASVIIKAREVKPIKTKKDLVNIVSHRGIEKSNILQKIFQALRIAVNLEYENLKTMLIDGFELLNKNGRIAVISFHSGEDRIVKQVMKELVKAEKAKWIVELTIPTAGEVARNYKARSAKLRAIEKITD